MQGTPVSPENFWIPAAITAGTQFLIFVGNHYAKRNQDRVTLQSTEAKEIDLRNKEREEKLNQQQEELSRQLWQDRQQQREEMDALRAGHREEIERLRADHRVEVEEVTRRCNEEQRVLTLRVSVLEQKVIDLGGSHL